MPAGKIPDDLRLPVTEDWISRAKQAMEDMGLSQTDVAQQVGVSKMTVTNILGKPGKTSQHVAKISDVLQIAASMVPVQDARELMWLGMGRALREMAPSEYDAQTEKIGRIIKSLQLAVANPDE